MKTKISIMKDFQIMKHHFYLSRAGSSTVMAWLSYQSASLFQTKSFEMEKLSPLSIFRTPRNFYARWSQTYHLFDNKHLLLGLYVFQKFQHRFHLIQQYTSFCSQIIFEYL